LKNSYHVQVYAVLLHACHKAVYLDELPGTFSTNWRWNWNGVPWWIEAWKQHKKRRRGRAACWLLDVPTAARMVHTSAMWYRSVLIEHFAAAADGSFRLEAVGRSGRSRVTFITRPRRPNRQNDFGCLLSKVRFMLRVRVWSTGCM